MIAMMYYEICHLFRLVDKYCCSKDKRFTDSYSDAKMLIVLDHGSKIIIFESILTTFMASFLKGSSKNWLEVKIEPT
jgi:hypothetical protein